MFKELYTKGAAKCIEDNFIHRLNEELLILTCNLKLYQVGSGMIDLIGKDPKELLYENLKGPTYEDLTNFIKDDSYMKIETRRCFVNDYELFERTLSEIVEYIHYKKPQIILNKDNEISLSELFNEKTKEEIIEEKIASNIKNIMFSRGIKHILKFIKRHTKCGDLYVEEVYTLSNIRNSFVHDSGRLSMKEYKTMTDNGCMELVDGKGDMTGEYVIIDVDLDSVDHAKQIYLKIVIEICESLIKLFES